MNRYSSTIRTFCGSIVRGWCYFDFLKGTLGKSQDNFVDVWDQLCVLSVIFCFQVILCVTELGESWPKLKTEGVNKTFGCFGGCFRVTRQVGLS